MMNLFSLTDINSSNPPDKEVQPAAFEFKAKPTFAMGRKGVALENVLPNIKKEHTYHVPSLGNWSTHDMLAYLLNKITGPADVWITTWSIKKKAVEIILELMDAGTIKSLNAVFDNRVKAQCPDAWQLADANLANTYLTKIHAKTIVIANERYNISIVTTANFTYNPRVEVYTITEHAALAQYHLSWIKPMLKGAKPFHDE